MSTEFQPAITFLNMSGDVTLQWTPENEKAILALVEAKMKAGVTFFILKPRFLGLFGKKKVAAASVEDIAEAGMAVVDDAEFQRVVAQLHDPALEDVVRSGKAQLAKPAQVVSLDAVRRAKSPEEVVKQQTVAVRRVVGG